jgi:hypothetical protein
VRNAVDALCPRDDACAADGLLFSMQFAYHYCVHMRLNHFRRNCAYDRPCLRGVSFAFA